MENWLLGARVDVWKIFSVVGARDDKSNEKCSYSKDILKEGSAEFAMHRMQGRGQNRAESANSSPQAESTPPSAFVNKLFMEHSHAHFFTIVYGCFPATIAELNTCDRDLMACKA